MQWTNWSGSVSCNPQSINFPTSEAELQEIVHSASSSGKTIRVVGTGHSFVPLCATDEVLISLDQMQGKVEMASQPGQATFWAGTKIHQIGEPLWNCGLAMANMGDIDRQSIAGAVGTGTHGTGQTLGNISTQVTGLRLVLASGEILDCSETQEPEIFKAAQVSLGMLGIVSQVTLRCLPTYHLHERTWVAGFDECLENLDQHIANNRHFEFFWSPNEDACAMKVLNPVALSAEDAASVPIVKEVSSEVKGRLARYIKDERIDRSYRIFPSERNLKFNEMEFAIPAANGVDCLREIRQLMQTRYPQVLWPIEYRTLAADDIWLSPAFGRETVTISIHQAAELDPYEFFADAEAIFRNHKGRPHWGKMHSHRANDLAQLYPNWDRFLHVHQSLNANRFFTNPYLRTLVSV